MGATIDDVLSGRAAYCVVEGDCLDILKAIPEKSVAHVISDPPYEASAHTKQRRSLKDATQKNGAANKGEVRRVDATLPFAQISEVERAAVAAQWGRIATRWVVAFCQIEAIGVWRDVYEAGGLEWVRGGIWRKPDGMPQFTGDRPGMGFESIAIGHQRGRKKWNGGGKHGVWTCGLDHGHGNGVRSEHPTKKPEKLMLEIVSDFTDPGDVIVDSYAGSGTTGVAAVRLGRRAILIEKDPTYAALIRERLASESADSTLAASRAGQVAMFAK